MVGIFLKNRLSFKEYLPALQPFLPCGEQVWACEPGEIPLVMLGRGMSLNKLGLGTQWVGP